MTLRRFVSCRFVSRSLVAASMVLAVSFVRADDHKLSAVKKGPEGLSPAIEKLLDTNGHQISGPDGPVVEVWLLKGIEVKEKFKPSALQQYPLIPGQLLGAMRISKAADDYTDFRGQQMSAGTYTLRYGLQPQDGNHVGTSDTYDFILALPAKTDVKTTPIKDFRELAEISAKAAGSTHPAIFSLLDPKTASKEAKLTQDDFTEHWILSLQSQAKAKDKAVDLKIRLVVVGKSEG
ncbi:MAG: hypothetical protein O2820_15995 [Planctomycetota bacterium]|nr:hypothetical protein [Planctomycetota bacterium]MDA1250720.1 hypothetical protein [Planctomycetota bacterium]